MQNYDVIIVGGGPAAHSAALALGRSRKRVLVCDEGSPRNRVSRHSHSFFTRDGAPPLELRRIAVDQLRVYETVEVVRGRVNAIQQQPGGLRVEFADRDPATTRLVLLAVGMLDDHLDVDGFSELWGDTVIHCPYCHGWEVRDLPWAVYVIRDEPFPALARVRSWSSDVMLIVRDDVQLQPETERKLRKIGYTFERGTISALHSAGEKLESIELAGGRRLSRQVLLYSPPQRQTPLVEALGLALDDEGYVATDEMGQTSMPGVYAAGDLVTPRQQIAIAAANGVMTAIAMDTVLATSAVTD